MRRIPIAMFLVIGVLLLAVIERRLAPRFVARRPATAGAQWIWAPANHRGITPLAFQAAREFELATPPSVAEILIQADEEYLLYLNGTLVGGGRYRPGAPLDRYRVAALLRSGRNRVLVGLSSGRRAGGLLVALVGGDGLEVVSGPDWRILLRHRLWHRDPDLDLTRTWAPRLWGLPPTGRWRNPEPGPVLPLYAELVTSERRRQPRWVLLGDDWQPIWRLREASPAAARVVTLDWGREVIGYLGLRFVSRRAPEALLYFGLDEPADIELDSPNGRALGPRGRPRWRDSLPRRFRYVTVVSTDAIRSAYVVAADEVLAAPLLELQSALPGVFGLADPPALVSPVEDEIRRELEGFPGLVVGQPG